MTHCHTIIETLRQRGYRITPQREIVVRIIAHSNHHLSAEEIFTQLQVQAPSANVSTVYRTLEMLWEEGFTCRNDLSEGKIVYATRQHGPHIHLICRRCDHVIEAAPDVLFQLGKALLADYQFTADLDHLSIFGLCAHCEDDPFLDHSH
jgi:Fur family ferric uptake transcriptional regulator